MTAVDNSLNDVNCETIERELSDISVDATIVGSWVMLGIGVTSFVVGAVMLLKAFKN